MIIALVGLRQGLSRPQGFRGALGQADSLGELLALLTDAAGMEQKPYAHSGAQGKNKQIEHQFDQKEIGALGTEGHASTSSSTDTPQRGA